MANFFSKLFKRKNKKDKQNTELQIHDERHGEVPVNESLKINQQEINPENVWVKPEEDEQSKENMFNLLHHKNIAEFDNTMDIALKIKDMSEYSSLGVQFENYLNELDKSTFTKEDVAPFLESAEKVVENEGQRLVNLNNQLTETQKTYYAIQDISRIKDLADKAVAAIPDMTTQLGIILEKVNNIKEDEDILIIFDEFKSTGDSVKDVAFLFEFVNQRLDYLSDRDTEKESIVYYNSKYSDYNDVYVQMITKMDMMNKLSEKLSILLSNYKKLLSRSRGKGVMNIDWDNRNYNTLSKMKSELTDGYAKLEKDFVSVKKNVIMLCNNLMKMSDETKNYLNVLCPKLASNMDMLKEQKENLSGKITNYNNSIEDMKSQLSQIIKMLNTLYVSKN